MSTENITLNIYQKLHKIQEAVMGLGKDKKALTYSYVTGDKVLGYIKPLMNELGLLLKSEVLSIENVRQDYLISPGTDRERPKSEINSKVMMRFTWVNIDTKERDENLFGANGQNDWDKGVGSALTYAERYFLLKYFHIATDEDDIDNPDRKPEEKSVINDEIRTKATACKTAKELWVVYESYPGYKDNEEFIKYFSDMKAKLTNAKQPA